MGKRNAGVDAYIEKAADFAKPILRHVREVIHAACPDVEEAMKWGMPSFAYHGIMCNMAAFKEHCAFGFWKGKILFAKSDRAREKESMGNFGRIARLSDLPSDAKLTGYIRKAMSLNERGVPMKRADTPRSRVELKIPSYFKNELSKNKKALETFKNFSTGNKKDYVEWIIEAKTEPTRSGRMKKAIKWMAEGKIRNWKYIKK